MEQPMVKVKIHTNASAKIECERAEITLPDGSIIIKEGKFFLCRCGVSQNQPFCDGTHKTCEFEG